MDSINSLRAAVCTRLPIYLAIPCVLAAINIPDDEPVRTALSNTPATVLNNQDAVFLTAHKLIVNILGEPVFYFERPKIY